MVVRDSRGILTTDREMEPYQRPYAHDPQFLSGLDLTADAPLAEVITKLGGTALLGLSGQGGQFDRATVDAVSANTDRPIVFPLSNPTENTEVLPADALRSEEHT